MQKKRCRFTLSLISCLAFQGASAQQAVSPWASAARELPFEVALKPTELSNLDLPALSPDGKSLAYSLYQQTQGAASGTDPAQYHKGTRLFLKNLVTGQVRELAKGSDAAYAPSWSPDGSSVAYYVLRGDSLLLYLYNIKSGQERKVLAQVVDDPLVDGSVAWSQDSRTLAVTVKPANMPHPLKAPVTIFKNPSGVQVEEYTTQAQAMQAPPLDLKLPENELALVQVATGRVERLSHPSGGANFALPKFSPSGQWLLIPQNLRLDPLTGGALFDLTALRRSDQKRFVIQQALPMGQSMFNELFWGWHPKRDELFFFKNGQLFTSRLSSATPPLPQPLSMRSQHLQGNVYAFSNDGETIFTPLLSATPDQSGRHIAAISLRGNSVQVFNLPENLSFTNFVRKDQFTIWQPTKQVLTLGVRDVTNRQSAIVQYDLAHHTLKTLLSRSGLFTAGQVRWNAVQLQSGKLLTTYQDFSTPPMIARLDASGLNPVVVADRRATQYPLGKATFIETPFTDRKGKTHLLHTAIFLPPNWQKEQPLPTLAHQYGGADLSPYGLSYGGGQVGSLPAGIFTSRGYAVMQLDVHLEPEGLLQDTRTALSGPVLAQVRHAAELGLIDARRVAVIGQSYGGFGVAALLTDSQVFRAGVAVAGLYDLSNTYSLLNGIGSYWAEQGQGRLGGTPWEKPSAYLENSPFYQARSIQTPLLMIHGKQDDTSPPMDAQKMFMALKRQGKPAELLLYPRGGHVISEWPYEDAADAAQRILRFLQQHLK